MSKKRADTVIRTCVVCRKRMTKPSLDRYVWLRETGTVVLDTRGVMPGRGAYCCDDEMCKERFLTRKQGWKRAFRLN